MTTLPLHLLSLLGIGATASLLATRLPLAPALEETRQAAGRGLRTLTRAAVSDHWKERVLRLCVLRLLRGMAGVLACLAALLGGVAILATALDALVPGLWSALVTWWGTLALTAGSALHLAVLRPWRHV